MEIKLGSEVIIEGKKFIIIGIVLNQNKEGWSVNVNGWDEMIMMGKGLERDTQAEFMRGAAKVMRKVEEDLD